MCASLGKPLMKLSRGKLHQHLRSADVKRRRFNGVAMVLLGVHDENSVPGVKSVFAVLLDM